MRKIFLFAGIFISVAAAASGGAEHHGPEGIPWKLIGVQTFNFSLVVGALVYFLRDKLKAHFAERRAVYSELIKSAEAARAQAEAGHKIVSEKIRALESQAGAVAEKARAEAEELKSKILTDAKQLSSNLKEEAKRSVQHEIDRAKTQLRQELLTSALDAAHSTLRGAVGASEQKRLQAEFVEKIQVVR